MKRRFRAMAGAALALALAAGACTDNGPPEAEPTSPGTSTATATSPPPTPPRGRFSPGPTVTATPPGRTTTPTTRPGSPSPSPPAEVVVTLDRACVRRNVETDVQGITVRTRPGYPAGFVTEYSDGSTIIHHPEYQSGGQASGFADANGIWRHTWVVPRAAPLGRAIVHVNTGTADPAKIPFTIVGQNQQCR